jgi:F0F1-type ATP synthase assembly protein I
MSGHAVNSTAANNSAPQGTDPGISEKRELTRQMGRTTGGYELVFSPMLLALLGYGIDRLFGTVPVFTIALGVLGLLGAVVKIYFTYRSDMEQHEASGPWVR